MRMSRKLALLAATLVGLAGGLFLAPSPAFAGNWAVTVLDPLPDRLEPGKGYTVGMWVLQHGFHPYEGDDLGPVALRLVDGKGTAVVFPAVALPEAAHYATAIAVPHAGEWAVVGVQGRFADYHVGTLTVPGGLAVLGVPPPLESPQADRYWPGAIRPPAVPQDAGRDPFGSASTVQAAAPGSPSAAPTPAPAARAAPAPAGTPRVTLMVAVTAGILAVAAFLSYRRKFRH
ncbi:hypothetical protein ACFO1B_34380 [Dactylosporangium siamense]|uniref:Uncharacterized protein n=1 Tax=Dactylosporangium siamense TaxID=685454 RepID=A0A919PJD9_9ACTN|nr:hypothetical protein [Dactylosporangium siamense]GIG44794.1 hypothetical protein Dsi01nite_028350 [Dactylosporangium siamense]